MTTKGARRNLPDKPGGKVPGRGKVTKIRTVVPKPGRYIHVRVVEKPGPQGGKTIASGVQKTKAAKKRSKKGKR